VALEQSVMQSCCQLAALQVSEASLARQLASGTSSKAADAHASSILHHSSKIAYLVLSKQPDDGKMSICDCTDCCSLLR